MVEKKHYKKHENPLTVGDGGNLIDNSRAPCLEFLITPLIGSSTLYAIIYTCTHVVH